MEQEKIKKIADELLDKIFSFELDRTFTLATKSQDNDELLFFKRQVGSAQYLYAMHLSSKNVGGTFDFDHVGIVANGKLYLMANSIISGLVRKELLATNSVVSFRDEYAKASSLEAEMDILEESRNNMPDDLISKAATWYDDASFTRSARRCFFESYPNTPIFYERQGYLTPDDYAAYLCGLQNIPDTIRENVRKSGREPELVYIARKTEEEFCRNGLIKDWEFSMIEALSKCREKGHQSVMVSFKNHKSGEATPYFKIDIRNLIDRMANESGFAKGHFETDIGKILHKYGYLSMPGCNDIVSIKCKGKEIYRKDGQEKETEDMELC